MSSEGRPPPSSSRWLLVLGSLALGLLAAELAIRGAYSVRKRANPPKAVLDSEWGWRSAPALDVAYTTRGYGRIEYSTNAEGFRASGDIDADRPKVFVVGDSFTQAYQVSDGEAYYNFLSSDDRRVEVFAYGVAGHATLQEGMVLRHYLQPIDPDVILWQFHPNDLIGSSVWLESRSGENNNHMVRPYLENGRIVRRHPDGLLGAVAIRSLLARRVAVLRTSLRKRLGTVEDTLHPGHPELEKALEAMRTTVSGLVGEHPGRSFVAFQVPPRNVRGWEELVFERVCEVDGLSCIGGLDLAFERARASGLQLDGGGDPHWNAAGHRTAGRLLRDALLSSGLLDARRSGGSAAEDASRGGRREGVDRRLNGPASPG